MLCNTPLTQPRVVPRSIFQRVISNSHSGEHGGCWSGDSRLDASYHRSKQFLHRFSVLTASQALAWAAVMEVLQVLRLDLPCPACQCMHACTNVRNGMQLADRLQDRDVRVCAYDRRGYGWYSTPAIQAAFILIIFCFAIVQAPLIQLPTQVIPSSLCQQRNSKSWN